MHMLMIQQKIQQQEQPEDKDDQKNTSKTEDGKHLKKPNQKGWPLRRESISSSGGQKGNKNKFNAILVDHSQQLSQKHHHNDPNNMTFSEAKQPVYQNLDEFQQINHQKQQNGIGRGFEESQQDKEFQNHNNMMFDGVPSQGNIEGQINETLNNLRRHHQSGQSSEKISSQVTPQSTIVSSLQAESGAQGVYQKLNSKGQIKIHKGLKRSYLVNSKQNSMPPKHGSSIGERPSAVQRIASSNPIGSNQSQQKRQNIAKQAHKTIEDDAQIDFYPNSHQKQFQQKDQNNDELNLLINNNIHQKSKSIKVGAAIKAPGILREELVPQTDRIQADETQQDLVSQKIKIKQKIIVKNNNQVSMKSSNQLMQGQTKSYKKLRKPSHQKHNSIDRAHQSQITSQIARIEPHTGIQFQEPNFSKLHLENEHETGIQNQGNNLQLLKMEESSVEKQSVNKQKKRNPKQSKIISNQKQHISQRKSPVVQGALLQQPVESKNNLNTIAGGPVNSNKQNIHVTHHRHVKGQKRDKQGEFNSFDSNLSPKRAVGMVPDPQIICNKILKNLNDNFKRGTDNTGSSGTNKKGKGSSGGTNNSNSWGNKQAFEAANQAIPSGLNHGGYIKSTGNNSFYINGPVHIINVTTSNSKSNKSSGETAGNQPKKLSSSKSGEHSQFAHGKKSHTKTFVTHKNHPQQNFQIFNDQNQMIFATQDNCNPGIIRSANKNHRPVQDEPSANLVLQEARSTPPDEVKNFASVSFQQPTQGHILQTRSFGAAGQGDRQNGKSKQNNIYKSFDFYQLSNASKNPDSSGAGANFVAGPSIPNMTREQIKQSILVNQGKQLLTLRGSGGPSGGEGPSVKNGSSGDAGVKATKSQHATKNTKKGASFQLFNTEDNRSSFNKHSKKSAFSGGAANSGGLPGGSTNGLVQNKTSSSNKNTRVRDSVELRVTKRSNFLDEFDQFEEQFEKHQNTRKKVYVNDNPNSQAFPRNITNVLSNKVSKESKESKKSKKSQNQKNLIQTNQNDPTPRNERGQGNQSKNQKLVNSFMKSQSSDKIKPNWSKRDSQNQINQQYDSYMKDYANFAAVTKKLLDQKSQIEAQRGCEQCQYLEPDAQYEKDSANENQIIGVYKGLEYQQIQHNQASYGVESYNTGSFAGGCIHQQQSYHRQQQNRIVSQSKIIIPRGIVNFKKGHSVSIERNGQFQYQSSAQSPTRADNYYNNFNQVNQKVQTYPAQPQIVVGSTNYQQNDSQQPKIVFNNNFVVDQPQNIQNLLNTSNQNQFHPQSEIHSRDNSLMPYKQNLLTEIDEEFQNKTPRLLNDYGFLQNKINTCVSQTSNEFPTNGFNRKSQDSASVHQQMTMQSNQNNVKSFILEPRDESLMRKKKVIQILQSFQENDENQEEKGQNVKKGAKKKVSGNNTKAQAQCYNFGEQFDFIENKLPQEPAKKKSHSNVPLSLESFNNELQNHTYYVGKPIVIQQQNRVKKNNKNTRRRDQPPDNLKKALQNEQGDAGGEQCGLMSDLDDFMRIEDFKIDEREEKFIQQTQLNQQKRQLKKELNDQFGQKRNIGSFDDEIRDSDQKVLENDLGVDFVGDSQEEEKQETIENSQNNNLTMQNDLPQDSSDFNEIVQPGILLNLLPQSNQEQINMNLNSQIKNIDSIFEPEPESQTPISRKDQ